MANCCNARADKIPAHRREWYCSECGRRSYADNMYYLEWGVYFVMVREYQGG